MNQQQNVINTELIEEILQTYPDWVSPRPPGCFSQFVLQPTDVSPAMEIGIVQEHRFAFFYWLKWWHEQQANNKIKFPPNLVTVDWHNDVGNDSDFCPDIINKLDYSNTTELALFCWCGLRPLNDGHIAPAMFLNAINNVYVILKQGEELRKNNINPRHYAVTDKFGNQHMVHYYSTVDEFLDAHEHDKFHPFIFDLDLDYFTEYYGENHPDLPARNPVSNQTIRAVVKNDSRFMQWLFPRMCGMTIALEPKYCGGVNNCLRILDVISSCLFDPPLFHTDSNWKHLKSYLNKC